MTEKEIKTCKALVDFRRYDAYTYRWKRNRNESVLLPQQQQLLRGKFHDQTRAIENTISPKKKEENNLKHQGEQLKK